MSNQTDLAIQVVSLELGYRQYLSLSLFKENRVEWLKTAGREKDEEEKMIWIIYQLNNAFGGNSGYSNIHTQILNIFTALCYLQIPFTQIVLFDFYSNQYDGKELIQVLKSGSRMWDPAVCFLSQSHCALIWFCGIGIYDSTIRK